MNTNDKTIDQLTILGEQLSLDFVNTAGWHLSKEPHEWLKNYKDLVAWSYRIEIVSKEKTAKLLKLADTVPDLAMKVYEEAMELREVIFRIFRFHLNNKPIENSDLSFFNKCLRRAYQFFKVDILNSKFTYVFEDLVELDCMLWEIVQSTTEFIVSPEFAKLKICEGNQCGWLFIDTSRNHSRRWCSMEDCGNREKAKRFYRKKSNKISVKNE